MIKAIMMDVGKTVVTNRIIDFKKALKAVYDLDDSEEKIDFERYLTLNNELRKISFDYARKMASEVRIDDFLEVLNNVAGINTGLDKKELEWFFQCHLIEEELIDGVKEFLEYIKSKNIPVIAVSNSCMSSDAIGREFSEFGIRSYFKEIISSADIFIRKPRKEIFEYAFGKLLKLNPTIKKDEVLFIGDNYLFDVVGSFNCGLVPVWFNQAREEATDNAFSFINVGSYKELIDIIKAL